MDIKLENIDSLNAIVTIDVDKEDYLPKVDKVLKDYKKSANIPGFRKGHVPMGLIKKQYGKAVMVDEVNKLLQQNLQEYITEQKLDILGNPIPKVRDDFDWNNENFQFEFELGFSPEFEIDLQPKKAITHYNIEADKEMVDDQIKALQKKYGKLVSQSEVKEGYLVRGTFVNEALEIDNETTIKVEDFNRKKDQQALIDSKVKDKISFKTKGLFKEPITLFKYIGIEEEKAKDLDEEVVFTINEINEEVSAELNEELFQKLYPTQEIKTEEDLRSKIKEDAENQLIQQSDQQLLNQVSEYLLENVKFDLPTHFLQKWIKVSSEKEMTEEEAKEEYQKSEKGLRFQLIESKIIKDNNLQVTLEDIKNTIKERIKLQFAQFGQNDFTEEQLDSIVQNVLNNKEETNKVSEQVMSSKLIEFYKNNVNLKVNNVNYKKFIDEVYK